MKIYRSQTSNRYFAYHNEEVLKQGKYIFENNPTSILIVKELSEVEAFYTILSYSQKDGSELIIHSKPIDGIVSGCKVFINDVPAPDGRYSVGWFKSINVKNGLVADM